MSNTAFNAKIHYNRLKSIENLICPVLLLAEGLKQANVQLDIKEFNNGAAGALGCIAHAMSMAYDTLTDAMMDYEKSHDIKGDGRNE